MLCAETFTIGLAKCVCLVDELGNRTMRPCLSNAVKVQVQFFFACLYVCISGFVLVHVFLSYVFHQFKD